MLETTWYFKDAFSWQAIGYGLGALVFLLLAWQCLRLVGRQGGVRWVVGVFLALLWVNGWAAATLGTIGETFAASIPVRPNQVYAVALIVASLAGMAGIVLGSYFKVGRLNAHGRGVPVASELPMARGIIVLATMSILAFIILNRHLMGAYWETAKSLGSFLIEHRRATTKYFLVGEGWTGQGAIKDFQTSCALLLGAVLGRRLADRHISTGAVIRWLAILLLAVLLSIMDASRSGVMVLLLTIIAAICGVSSRIFPRKLIIFVGPIAAFFFLTGLTKVDFETYDSPVQYGQAILIQSLTRFSLGNAVHDWQVAELMASGQLNWGHGGEALAQAQAMLPGAPPPRLEMLLREKLSRYPRSTTFFSTTEIGRRLYDGGALAVGIGFFLAGLMVAWMSKRAGRLWMDPVRGPVALVLGMIYATSSGVIEATTVVLLTLVISHAAVWIDALLTRDNRRGRFLRGRKAVSSSTN